MSIESLAAYHYEKARVVRRCGILSELSPPEERLLEIYREQVSASRVLDLGCGGGRTTAHLRALAKDYVGLDYSARMIECCRERFPHVKFVHGDATNLVAFGPAAFDFVMFSYNGIDTMSHDNRLRVLAEVHRVLVPGGLFAFSSHNIERRGIVVAFDRSAPLRLNALVRNLKYLVSYLKVRHMQVKEETYSILSDPMAGYKQLIYYISRNNQIKQLYDYKFTCLSIVDEFGKLISSDEENCESRWFYYMCRKSDEFERLGEA